MWVQAIKNQYKFTYTCMHTAAMIRGNHDNCCEFATQHWLRVFMKQLAISSVTHQVLTVIQCLLADSPEVLNIFSEADIGVIVNLLNTNGRDSEVIACFLKYRSRLLSRVLYVVRGFLEGRV